MAIEIELFDAVKMHGDAAKQLLTEEERKIWEEYNLRVEVMRVDSPDADDTNPAFERRLRQLALDFPMMNVIVEKYFRLVKELAANAHQTDHRRPAA